MCVVLVIMPCCESVASGSDPDLSSQFTAHSAVHPLSDWLTYKHLEKPKKGKLW